MLRDVRVFGRGNFRAGVAGLACASLLACQAPPPGAMRTEAVMKAPRAAASDEPLPLAGPLAAARRTPSVALLPGLPAAPAVRVFVGAEAPPALGEARRVHVVSTNGASYVADDGSIVATIPPGALDRDADVRFERVSVAGLPATSAYVPGVRFRADLGGARLRPDAAIAVRTRVEPATLRRWQALDPDFSFEKYNLVDDGRGGVAMTMAVRGPAARAREPVAARAAEAWGLVELGALPLPAAAGRTLMAGETRIASRPPTSLDELHAMEKQGLFGCDALGFCLFLEMVCAAYRKPDWASCGVAFADPAEKQPIGAAAAPEVRPAPPAPGTPAFRAARLPVRAVWTSDDPTVEGQPAAGAIVRFGLPGGAGFGPNEVVADAAGEAASSAPVGAWAAPRAFDPLFPAVGAPVEAVVADAMPPVVVKIAKNSPVVVIAIDGQGLGLAPEATVRYTLDGLPHEQKARVEADGDMRGALPLVVRVPDDATHVFALVGFEMAGLPAPLALPAPVRVRRNGTYAVAIQLGLAPPK